MIKAINGEIVVLVRGGHSPQREAFPQNKVRGP